jgi:hypothetical protein
VIVDGLFVESKSLALGEVWETREHRIVLSIKNVSNETRTIKEFGHSCDCTAVEPSTLTLDPGSQKDIEVRIDLTHRQPYQLGLERWPVGVEIRPVFENSFASSAGWKMAGVVRSRISLDAPKLAFGDQCNRAGSIVTRKIHAKAHIPLQRLEAVAPPEFATARVEPVSGSPSEYQILVSPRTDLPIGPFQFEVRIRAVEPDGSVRACASIDVSGEMQPTTRIFPKVILLGDRQLGETAEAEINVRLAAKDWKIDRIETDSEDISVSNGQTDEKGEVRLGVIQKIRRLGDVVSHCRIVIRKPDGNTEVVTSEVHYFGRQKAQ